MIGAMTIMLLLAGAQDQDCGSLLTADGAIEAKGESWFINADPIGYGPRRYTKYGLPRVIELDLLKPIGAYQHAPVLVEQGGAGEVIYVLVDAAECSFQPYQREG